MAHKWHAWPSIKFQIQTAICSICGKNLTTFFSFALVSCFFDKKKIILFTFLPCKHLKQTFFCRVCVRVFVFFAPSFCEIRFSALFWHMFSLSPQISFFFFPLVFTLRRFCLCGQTTFHRKIFYLC